MIIGVYRGTSHAVQNALGVAVHNYAGRTIYLKRRAFLLWAPHQTPFLFQKRTDSISRVPSLNTI